MLGVAACMHEGGLDTAAKVRTSPGRGDGWQREIWSIPILGLSITKVSTAKPSTLCIKGSMALRPLLLESLRGHEVSV